MTMPVRIRATPHAVLVALLLVGYVSLRGAVPVTAWAGESPLNVAVRDLVEHPDRYDGRRVVVSGFVTSIGLEQGRRGSEYAVLTVEEAVRGVPPTVYAVKVVSLTPPHVRKCQHALVQGVYHREGKQAGRPYELFIDAEAVLPQSPAESGPVPPECEEKL